MYGGVKEMVRAAEKLREISLSGVFFHPNRTQAAVEKRRQGRQKGDARATESPARTIPPSEAAALMASVFTASR